MTRTKKKKKKKKKTQTLKEHQKKTKNIFSGEV